MTSQLCRVQVTYSDRKNKHRITLERRYRVNITVLSSKELATFFITEMECVYCAVRTGSLNIIQVYVGLLISLKAQRLSCFAAGSTSL